MSTLDYRYNKALKTALSQLPSGKILCEIVLTDDFLSPEDVANKFGWSYTDAQLEHFAKRLADTKWVLGLRRMDCALIAGPPMDLNLLQVRELASQLFVNESGGWFSRKHVSFSRTDVVKAGEWLVLPKQLPHDPGEPVNTHSQPPLLNASALAYGLVCYLEIRGFCLHRGVYMQTISTAEDGHSVFVGNSIERTIRVLDTWSVAALYT